MSDIQNKIIIKYYTFNPSKVRQGNKNTQGKHK
jgi:hypothetical protein